MTLSSQITVCQSIHAKVNSATLRKHCNHILKMECPNCYIDKQVVSTVFLVSAVVQLVPSCTVDVGVTPCNAQGMNSHVYAYHCSSVS